MTGALLSRCLGASPRDEAQALTCGVETRTREELRAAVLARAAILRNLQVERGARVMFVMAKSAASVEWLFACLSLGIVAVPVDIRTPQKRLEAILESIEPTLIVVDQSALASLQACTNLPIFTSVALTKDAPEQNLQNLPSLNEDELALILMSSGSTGVPKGICLTHGNLLAFVTWAVAEFGFDRDDRFINIAPLHFDLSLLDVLASQYVGGSVHLLTEKQTMFPAEIVAHIEACEITVIYTVPTVLRMILATDPPELRTLRWVLFAGEVLSPDALPMLAKMAPASQMANLYGPTETNVVSCHILGAAEFEGTSQPLPIGTPCPHSRVWICDALGNPVKNGDHGEICAQGPTVMAGYWRQDDLTQQSRLAGHQNSFRTGDYGCQDLQGVLHFSGRRDQRVKIRGNLVDLSEIEHFAMMSGMLKAAMVDVVAESSQQTRLVLKVLPHAPEGFNKQALSVFLHMHLPAFCQPSMIEALDTFPMTLSGKVQRTRGPAVEQRTAQETK